MSKAATSKKTVSKAHKAGSSTAAATQPASRKTRVRRSPGCQVHRTTQRGRPTPHPRAQVHAGTRQLAHLLGGECRAESMQAEAAFEAGWFGHRSLTRMRELLTNLRARYEAFPGGTAGAAPLAGHGRRHPEADLPLASAAQRPALPPVQRGLPARSPASGAAHASASSRWCTWLGDAGGGRWSGSTRLQLASKLLSTAHSAGLIQGKRDPRPIVFPLVPDDALTYLLHLLREVDFEGTVLENPYLRSVGLEGELAQRSAQAPAGPELRPPGRSGGHGLEAPATWRHWAAHAGLGGR